MFKVRVLGLGLVVRLWLGLIIPTCAQISYCKLFGNATYYYYYYKCIDLSDIVTQALQGHCTHNK